MKIRRGDQVLVLSGKDRTKKGKIIRVFPENSRIVVEGLNIRKKHRRPRRAGQKGEKIEVAAPIHVSNVQLICPKCSKPTRIGYVIRGNNKKFRICKKCKGEFE